MTFVVLVILAAMWAAVLLPPYLRNRQEIGRRRDPVGAFRTQLNVLGRAAPTVVAPATRLGGVRAPHGTAMAVPSPGPAWTSGLPTSSSAAERRRRDVIRLLVAAVAVTFLAWFVTGATTVAIVHVLVDLAFVGYAAMLVQHRRNAVERAEKVRYLRGVPSRGITDPVLLRSSAR